MVILYYCLFYLSENDDIMQIQSNDDKARRSYRSKRHGQEDETSEVTQTSETSLESHYPLAPVPKYTPYDPNDLRQGPLYDTTSKDSQTDNDDIMSAPTKSLGFSSKQNKDLKLTSRKDVTISSNFRRDFNESRGKGRDNRRMLLRKHGTDEVIFIGKNYHASKVEVKVPHQKSHKKSKTSNTFTAIELHKRGADTNYHNSINYDIALASTLTRSETNQNVSKRKSRKKEKRSIKKVSYSHGNEEKGRKKGHAKKSILKMTRSQEKHIDKSFLRKKQKKLLKIEKHSKISKPVAYLQLTELSAVEGKEQFSVDGNVSPGVQLLKESREKSRSRRLKSKNEGVLQSNESGSLDSKSEISSIFNTVHQSRHHKLTRSDIRALAKKAVMLATLKHVADISNRKPSAATKVKELVSDKKYEISKKNRSKAKKKVGLNNSIPDNVNGTTGSHNKQTSVEKIVIENKDEYNTDSNDVSKATMETNDEEFVLPSRGKVDHDKQNEFATKDQRSEFTEDIKKVTSKKQKLGSGPLFSDETMQISMAKINPMLDTKSKESNYKYHIEKELDPNTLDLNYSSTKEQNTIFMNGKSYDDSPATDIVTVEPRIREEKKAMIEAQDDLDLKDLVSDPLEHHVESSYLLPKPIRKSEISKKNIIPKSNGILDDEILALKSALGKANPNNVPGKFLPDLPVGLRLIAWKELLKKKAKELSNLEIRSAILSNSENVEEKPVTINIDIDPEADKSNAKEVDHRMSKFEEVTPVKKASMVLNKNMFSTDSMTDLDENSNMHKHVSYLNKHISGARSLRKLIAKTLIGHCHATGQRLLDAFIAMDKALERAQAIASVIGKKFHVKETSISDLVGDKEDEVVETFLRDIFTKLTK